MGSVVKDMQTRVADNVVANFGRLSFSFSPAVGVDGCGTSAVRRE